MHYVEWISKCSFVSVNKANNNGHPEDVDNYVKLLKVLKKYYSVCLLTQNLLQLLLAKVNFCKFV